MPAKKKLVKRLLFLTRWYVCLVGSLRNVYGPTYADRYSLFTQYPEMPDSGNNYFKDEYKPTFYDKDVDFTDIEKDNCRLEDGDVSVECLHDSKVAGMDMDVLTETKELVETLMMDIKKLGKIVSTGPQMCVLSP